VQHPDPSVEKFWYITGLAAPPVIPYRTSIHKPVAGDKLVIYCTEEGTYSPLPALVVTFTLKGGSLFVR